MEKLNRSEISKLSYSQKIDYYSHSSNLISVNNGNTKTGLGCLTLSMPVLTCRDDAPCKKSKTCYCMKGRQVFPTVCGAYYRNWRIWNQNPQLFEKQLNSIITLSGLSLFRYNDAGEIVDSEYLAMMYRVALNHPDVRFLAYTKKYKMVNDFIANNNIIPNNLTIRYSMWDKTWKVPNPFNLPTAYVRFKDDARNPQIPTCAFQCNGGTKTEITCSSCQMCFRKEVKFVVFNQH